jgi:osmotically inducible protein OsmC
VGTGPLESGGFGLAVALELDAPEIERDEAIDLMRRAHEICPHGATRGNIQATLGIAGRSLEDQAA